MTVAHTQQKGVTLMELMIVVAIIAMIAAFAYPSYTNYIVNTKRTAAASTLLQIADRQQQFFMDSKSFTNDLTNLGYAEDPLFVSDNGTPVPVGDADAVYVISLANASATTYTAIAAPLGGQLTRDTDCGTMTLDQAGAKDALGGGDDCW